MNPRSACPDYTVAYHDKLGYGNCFECGREAMREKKERRRDVWREWVKARKGGQWGRVWTVLGRKEGVKTT
jgi:hypothetical protein